MTEILIKSHSRVKAFGEVFTPSSLVKQMPDLLDGKNYAPTVIYFDPACGNGNFLAEVLKRKIARLWLEYDGSEPPEWRMFDCAASVYGVDIQADNVEECRKRLFDICYGELSAFLGVNPVPYVSVFESLFKQNIRLGDTLKGDFFICSHKRAGDLLTVEIHPFNNIVEGRNEPQLCYTTHLPVVDAFEE